MSKSPWGNIGAWAAEAERADEEEREQVAKAAAEAASIGATQSQSFPTLKEATGAVKQSKKKTKMTLQELQRSYDVGLTPQEMNHLPRGPRERSSGDEMPYGSKLGDGFSNYGSRPSGPPSGRIHDRDSYGNEGPWGGSRKSYGGFEDETRQSRGPRPDFDQASRADEVDNWSTMKKPLPSFSSGPGAGPGPRPSRYASLGGGSGGASRSDDVGDWASSKKPIPPPSTRSYAFGSGLRESRPEPDRWSRDANTERQTLSLDLSKGEDGGGGVVVKVNKPNPFGAARPREEVLAEKGLDWKKLDMDIDAKKTVSRPTSSQSSRPGSSQSNRSEAQTLQGSGEGLPKPKTKVNPFGEAKPREVLLEEKGLDWRKIDLELDHRRVGRSETDEEKNLKEEIQHLKNEMMQKSGEEEQSTLSNLILQKERDLEILIRDLDDKVRFGQKVNARPGSGDGRFSTPVERVSSQQPIGAYEERRGGGEFMERPRSRGSVDGWPRSIDDRRSSQRGRGRGYSGGGRDIERSLSRERW